MSVKLIDKSNYVQSSYSSSYNETLFVSYSDVWCSQMSYEVEPFAKSAFYLLKTEPEPTDHDIISLPDIEILYSKYYSYYLRAGSNITISACLSSHSTSPHKSNHAGASFNFIVGKDNFMKWQNNVSMTTYVNYYYNITSSCTEPSPKYFTLLINETNHYYLAFELQNASRMCAETCIEIYRVKYRVEGSNIIDYCETNADYNFCYLDVRYKHNDVAMISFYSLSEDNDDTRLNVTTHCSYRKPVYVGIFFGILFLFFCIWLVVTLGFCFLGNWYHKRISRSGSCDKLVSRSSSCDGLIPNPIPSPCDKPIPKPFPCDKQISSSGSCDKSISTSSSCDGLIPIPSPCDQHEVPIPGPCDKQTPRFGLCDKQMPRASPCDRRIPRSGSRDNYKLILTRRSGISDKQIPISGPRDYYKLIPRPGPSDKQIPARSGPCEKLIPRSGHSDKQMLMTKCTYQTLK